MNSFYVDILSILFLFLTSITCFFALFSPRGLYWLLPFISSTILWVIRLLALLDPDAVFIQLTGRTFYLSMLTPLALLVLFFSSLLLRYGIRVHTGRADGEQPVSEQQLPVAQSRTTSPAVRAVPSPRQIDELFTLLKENYRPKDPKRSDHLFLCGIKHSGKSTIGASLSALLSKQFADSDTLLLEFLADSLLAGLSVREVYSLVGKSRFMLLEFLAMGELISHAQQQYIIALGGGVCDNTPLIDLLKRSGSTIFLDLPEQVLFERISQGGIPPFLDQNDPKGSFKRLYLSRRASYLSFCDLAISLMGVESIEQVTQIVATQVEERRI